MASGSKRTVDMDFDDSNGKKVCPNENVNVSEGEVSESDRHITVSPMAFLQQQMLLGTNPREILAHFTSEEQANSLPLELPNIEIWKLLIELLHEPKRRKKLLQYNTFKDCIDLIKKSKNIIIVTGAGISVSCGIPDFRSRHGIYARLKTEYPQLPDPQSMFDKQFFNNDPRPFFSFAREIYPGNFKPSFSHFFLKSLQNSNKLLRNYTQNIDNLEKTAGIQNLVQCHGSFATASCTICKYQVSCDDIRDDVFNQRIPCCPKCKAKAEEPTTSSEEANVGVMKPDIVFFGEDLPNTFYDQFDQDKNKVDLLLVIGSSLKVRPVALIPNSIPEEVPQILINREPLTHMNFDIELFGDCDIIISEIAKQLADTDCDNTTNWMLPFKETSITHQALTEMPKETFLTNINSLSKSDDENEEIHSNIMPNLAELLKRNEFVFFPNHHYVFHGAEIHSLGPLADDSSSSESMDESDTSTSSDSDSSNSEDAKKNREEDKST